ncbi:hypothetical protein ABFS82_04G135200 [Erythranthe guttata]|uniref:Glutathione S-transferase n=1 Tax=Erythranthe guttata TaxID=4155 RepID=A0A022RJ53_ERYGU|nr:PREDICTED: probable glutathione S-transferase [Erythranthe guttata]EYU40236.1 hypothetical protein MIMGU_mgv1a020023mg [Erythranthe guttata]|eukprot:XP_012834052.1 PREDICTED: probable glutathione S-transferase [Erythranthe guttata]
MGEVKLIGVDASFPCARIIWALKLKGVEYEFIEEDLLNKSSLLLKTNPVHKKVPVLIHGTNPIAESLVILEYIDEVWKTCPLLPVDPYERSVARFWAKFVDEKCVPSVWEAARLEGDKKEAAIVSAKQTLQLVEKQIEGKRFFGGEQLGYLDIVMGWMCLWLGAMEEAGGMKLLDSEEFPSLCEWILNFTMVPTIHESLPPKQNVVKYFQFGLNYMRSLAAPNAQN